MQQGTCGINTSPSCYGVKATGHVTLSPGELSLQSGVASVGPIAVAIDAAKPSFQFYR